MIGWRAGKPLGGRIAELDGLRGLAALLILAHHYKPAFVPCGWAAVDLFFVLSGFLITTIILRDGQEPQFLRNFYIRRGLRIWPIYYLAILALLLAGRWLPQANDPGGLPYALVYAQNLPRYWSGRSPEFSPYLAHTWSLAVEEQFYLLWPALVLLVGPRRLLGAALALLAGSVVARSAGLHWWLLLARGDGLALGAILAALRHNRERPGPALRNALIAIGLAATGYLAVLGTIGGLAQHGPPRWPSATLLAVNLLGFAAVGLVCQGAGGRAFAVLRRPRLVYLGQISYGLYLYHFIIMVLGDDLAKRLGMGGRPFWREALMLGCTFGLAALSWRFVERPLLAWKDRFAYRPEPVNVQAPTPHLRRSVATRGDRQREEVA
jgi:peptidoglycan/LPS O-acetylase OafA/YrhL